MKKYKKKKIKEKLNFSLVYYKKNSNNSFEKGTIDYKNLPILRHFITTEGKILSRKLTGLTAKQQRKIAYAIKTSRVVGLLPFINQ